MKTLTAIQAVVKTLAKADCCVTQGQTYVHTKSFYWIRCINVFLCQLFIQQWKEVCCSSGQCYALILLKSQDRITDSLKAVVRIRIQKEMKNGRGIFSQLWAVISKQCNVFSVELSWSFHVSGELVILQCPLTKEMMV